MVTFSPMIGTESLMAVISTAVTPVVLVSSCGTLAVSVNARQQHLSDRIRGAAAESRSASVSEERRAQLREQIRVFNRRFGFTWLAASALYGAIACFLVTTLWLVWTQRRLGQGPMLPLIVFVLGLTLMLGAAVCIVLEVALSRRTLQIEMRDLDLPLRKPAAKPEGAPQEEKV